jgi:hypothetical protein
MTKLDEILDGQTAIRSAVSVLTDRVASLEVIFGTASMGPTAPAKTGGLFDFVRPPEGTPRYGLGVEMNAPDVYEAKKRACSCVNWQGGQARSTDEDDVWAEIEKLKAGDEALISRYRMLDPEFAGFALLTGLFDVTKYDGVTFGINATKREACAGSTIQSFLDDQFTIRAGGGTPSGE